MSAEKKYCLNCGSELSGQFCSHCGQKDKDIHVPVKELAAEFIEVLPSFDERIMRSLRPLLFSPGILTLEYLSGKRKFYISPFKLYFFISFLFFLVSSFTDKKERALAELNHLNDSTAVSLKQDSAFVSVSSRQNKGLTISVRDSNEVLNIFGPSMIAALKHLKANPSLMFDKIKEHRPKIIFILMPVFALLLKLLYFRSKHLYIKHLVFSFYFHSFVFALFIIIDLIDLSKIPVISDLSVFLYLIVPAHLYFGLKRVYRQSRWKTAVKLMLLLLSYMVTFFIVIMSTVLLIVYMFYL